VANMRYHPGVPQEGRGKPRKTPVRIGGALAQIKTENMNTPTRSVFRSNMLLLSSRYFLP
jgi:hypothetical protein